MNNSSNFVKELLYILLAVLVGILVIKFVIWLLPIILVGIIAYFVYKAIKKNKKVEVNKKKNNKKRNIKVIHDLDDGD